MNLQLAEISTMVSPGKHALLLLDQAGWHLSGDLAVPDNITLLPLPPKCPELNVMENVWQFMRDNWLSNRIFRDHHDTVDHCCHHWNRLVAQPWRIMSIGLCDRPHRPRSSGVGIIMTKAEIAAVATGTSMALRSASSLASTPPSPPRLRAHPGGSDLRRERCGEASDHDADHRHAHEGGGDAAVSLEITREAAVAADPCDRVLDDPALRQHDKTMPVAATHDLDRPVSGTGDRSRHPRPPGRAKPRRRERGRARHPQPSRSRRTMPLIARRPSTRRGPVRTIRRSDSIAATAHSIAATALG
jgi:hypothetical protein